MTISLTVTANDADDLHAQLAAILGGVPLPQSAAQPPQSEPPKATRKRAEPATAAESPETLTAAASPASDAGTATEVGSEATTDDTDQKASDVLTYEADVKPAVLRVSAHPAAQGGGREGVLKLMEQFKVDHISKVPEDQWPALLDAIKLVLEG